MVGGSEDAIEDGFVSIITAGAGAEPVVVVDPDPVDPTDCDMLGFGQMICLALLGILPQFLLDILVTILSIFP